MQNVVFLFLMLLASISWAQFDDVYSSSPWDYEEDEAVSYTLSDESYNASIHDAAIYSDIDFHNDDFWMYDNYDYRYSRNISRFYQPIYGVTYYDFRYTNGFYYTNNPWDWGVNIYVNTSLWSSRRSGWNVGWNNAWWGGSFGPAYSVTTYYGWVNPWPSIYNPWHTSWGYGGLGWNNTWFGGYTNWYGHQYWAYNNPFCSGFGFDYNDWYADAGNVYYGPRLGGKSYGNRNKNKSFVMQEDGFDNPRMRAQGLSLSSTTSGSRSTQADDNRMGSTSSNTSVTDHNNQSLNTSRSAGQASMYNRSSKSGDNVSSQGVNQQATFRGNIQSHENTQTNRSSESVGSGFNNTNRSQDNGAFQENSNGQSSRGNKTENSSNIQGNQREQSSQGNGSLSNSRRSNSSNSSSGNKGSSHGNVNRPNGGNIGNIGNGGRLNNGGGSNRSNGGGSSNPRSRGGGR